MAVIFRDDFVGSQFTSIDGRSTGGYTWEDPDGGCQFNNDGQLTSSSGRCRIPIPSAAFAGATYLEVELGFQVSYGGVSARLCAPSQILDTTQPGNPGVEAQAEAGISMTLFAANNYSTLGGVPPTTGVITARMTIGSATCQLWQGGALLGTLNTPGSVPMAALPAGDMFLVLRFLYGGPMMNYVEVRADTAVAPPPPFWTDFVGSYEEV
ncbi:MAG: hypothetical protein EOP82_16495 [Variovorax sp.]|nr:MAG: hypothetical protein EOP82_16495 [Variovorax sp.]